MKRYFFSYVTSALKYSWQSLNGERFYLYSDGSVKDGFQKIGNYNYYVNNNYVVKGVREIGGATYYFDKNLGFLVEGFIQDKNSVYYQDGNGFFEDGWLEKDSKKYYFSNYKMLKGFNKIGTKTYFLSTVNGQLKTGWQVLNGNLFYLNDDGTVIDDSWQTIDNKWYYFKNHYAYRNLQSIDYKYYYFNATNGYLETGWITASSGKNYYSESDGVLLKGEKVINGGTYYFDENNFQMFTGFMTVENKKYYYDKNTGKKAFSTVKVINGNEYEFAADGELVKIQYVPVYYSQKDPRWSYLSYGRGTFGGNGCAPTSMTMAFQAILETVIEPTGVANYLYYQTQEYNKYTVGTSGLGIIKAADYWGVKYIPIKSKNQLDEELKKGRIIFAAMGNGKYATPNWNHAIILHRYHNGLTYSFDPLQGLNNTWVSTDLIWREKSSDPDDSRGRSQLYALYK